MMPIRRLRQAPVLFALVLSLLIAAGCGAPVRIEWSTETEMGTAGFNIYRGEAPDGPFDVKVNDQLIPASPDPVTGGKYSYVDSSAQAGKQYYYQLEEVEENGTVNKVGVTAARAGAFDWKMGLLLGGLAVGVLLVWIYGGRRASVSRSPGTPSDSQEQ